MSIVIRLITWKERIVLPLPPSSSKKVSFSPSNDCCHSTNGTNTNNSNIGTRFDILFFSNSAVGQTDVSVPYAIPNPPKNPMLYSIMFQKLNGSPESNPNTCKKFPNANPKPAPNAEHTATFIAGRCL